MIDTRLFPVLDPGKHFVKRSWMLPGVFTAIITVILSALDNPAIYFDVLAIYICVALYFFVDLLCHERKSFWTASVIALISFAIIASPLKIILLFPFRPTPLLNDATKMEALTVLPRFASFFLAAGLAEEFVKAIPVLVCLVIGVKFHGKFGRAFGVRSPLDGILFGAASGIGFSLFETLQQYVPQMETLVATKSNDVGLGIYAGLTLLIPRLLGDLFGHMAWAGYFGYFIGLAALRIQPTWKVLLIGWLSAAVLHGLWDSFADFVVPAIAIACLSYCFLAAAVLEARRLHTIAAGAPPPPIPRAVFVTTGSAASPVSPPTSAVGG